EFNNPFLQQYVLRPLVLAGALAEPAALKPSLLHLLRLFRIVVFSSYLVLPRGVASLAQTLAKRFKVGLERPVKRLLIEGGKVAGGELASGEVLTADHVVVAVPPAVALTLLPDDWTTERTYLSQIVMPPFMLATFFLNRPLDPHVWSY